MTESGVSATPRGALHSCDVSRIGVGVCAALVAVLVMASHASATNHHCANEQPMAASKRIVVAREITEVSDIYVTCWRATIRHRVIGAGLDSLRRIRIRGTQLRWLNHGQAKQARLGPGRR